MYSINPALNQFYVLVSKYMESQYLTNLSYNILEEFKGIHFNSISKISEFSTVLIIL